MHHIDIPLEVKDYDRAAAGYRKLMDCQDRAVFTQDCGTIRIEPSSRRTAGLSG